MANRPAIIKQSDATRLMKAAKAAGFPRARIILHDDGRIEVIAETVEAEAQASLLDQWRATNGQSKN